MKKLSQFYDEKKNNKMPIQTQLNNMELCPKLSELDRHCPVELMLISQVILFIFIVAKGKRVQYELKGLFLVATDLKRIWTILPKPCNEK